MSAFFRVINYEQFHQFNLFSSQISTNNFSADIGTVASDILKKTEQSNFQTAGKTKIQNILKKYKNISLIETNYWSRKTPYNALLSSILFPKKTNFTKTDNLHYLFSHYLRCTVQIPYYKNLNSGIKNSSKPTRNQKRFINTLSLSTCNDEMVNNELKNFITS